MKIRVVSWASVCASVLLCGQASAQSTVNNYWTGSAGNNVFTNAANWTPSAPLNTDYQSIIILRQSSLGGSEFAQTNRTINVPLARQVACVRFDGMVGWTFTNATLSIGLANDGQANSIYANTPGTNTFENPISLNKGTTKVDIGEGSVIVAKNGFSWNSILARVVGKGTLRIQGTHSAYSQSTPPTATNGVVELAASTGVANWQCLGVGVSKCFATSQVTGWLLVSENGFYDCNGFAQSPSSVGIGAPMLTSNTNHGRNTGGTINASNITFTVGSLLRMSAGTLLGRTNDLLSLTSPTFLAVGTNSPSRVFTSVRASSTSATACITNEVSRGSTPIDLDIYGNFLVANKDVKGPFLKLSNGVTRVRGDMIMTNAVASGYSIVVQAGTFLFDGMGYLRSLVSVGAGAAFGGACTLTNSLAVPATATLVPGNEAGQAMTCRGGLTLSATSKIAMDPAARTGGIAVTGGALSVTGPVTVTADMDGVANGDYTVLDSSAVSTPLSLASFDLTDLSDTPYPMVLVLKNSGTRLVLRKGTGPTTLILR